MLTVVEIAGMQYEVEQNALINVPLLQGDPGEIVEFSNILVAGDNIGTPYIEGSVKAEIIEHGKGDKVLVFKKKRRKGYQKLNGHRQRYTRIKITEINLQ